VWKAVSIDPATDTNQTSRTYWKRIKMEFDERTIVDPVYTIMFMSRTQKAMSARWGNIQDSVNLFHGFFENIQTQQESGTNASTELEHAL
jgi:hypothetical protein